MRHWCIQYLANNPNPQCTFSLIFNKEYYLVSTYKRPHLDQFLERVFDLFEVVFYTSSVESYANNIIDYIDPDKRASGRLFRDAWIWKDQYYIKDLSRLGRDQSSIIIIDNSPTAYCRNIENAVPIKTWFNDKNDTELVDLLPILESLAKVKDVREVINKIIDKMSEFYGSSDVIVDNWYEEDSNIRIEDREKYIQVIGNYYPNAEEYNPARISMNANSGNDMIKSKDTMASSHVRFSSEEVNAFVFNHLHWQYSSNMPNEDEVMYEQESDGGLRHTQASKIKLSLNDNGKSQFVRNRPKGFFQNTNQDYNGEFGQGQFRRHGNVGQVDTEDISNQESDLSFYKNLENPSSVTDSHYHSSFDDKEVKQKLQKNDGLRTFFWFDA